MESGESGEFPIFSFQFSAFNFEVLKADGLAREDKKALKEKAKIYKKRVVVLALLLVFGVLAVVKYHNFAIENVNGIIKAFGGNGRISTFTLLLPLGISFYSFQSISYVIDVYRGKVKACNNIFKYALFVSYFPQITQVRAAGYTTGLFT